MEEKIEKLSQMETDEVQDVKVYVDESIAKMEDKLNHNITESNSGLRDKIDQMEATQNLQYTALHSSMEGMAANINLIMQRMIQSTTPSANEKQNGGGKN